jgi:hypothetical protein
MAPRTPAETPGRTRNARPRRAPGSSVPPEAFTVGQHDEGQVEARDLQVQRGVGLLPQARVPDELEPLVLLHVPTEAVGQRRAVAGSRRGHHGAPGLGGEQHSPIEGDIELGEVEDGRDDTSRGTVALGRRRRGSFDGSRRAKPVRRRQEPREILPQGQVAIRAGRASHAGRGENEPLDEGRKWCLRRRHDGPGRPGIQHGVVGKVIARCSRSRVRQQVPQRLLGGLAAESAREDRRLLGEIDAELCPIAVFRHRPIEVEHTLLDQPERHGRRDRLGDRSDVVGRLRGGRSSTFGIRVAETQRQDQRLVLNHGHGQTRDAGRDAEIVQLSDEGREVGALQRSARPRVRRRYAGAGGDGQEQGQQFVHQEDLTAPVGRFGNGSTASSAAMAAERGLPCGPRPTWGIMLCRHCRSF